MRKRNTPTLQPDPGAHFAVEKVTASQTLFHIHEGSPVSSHPIWSGPGRMPRSILDYLLPQRQVVKLMPSYLYVPDMMFAEHVPDAPALYTYAVQ